MNRLRICSLFFAFAVIAARAEETNTPSTASATSNTAPSGVTSNAAPSSIKIDGTTYEEVRWGRVTLSTVTIFHKTGVATIPLEKLPPELQKRFGYDPQRAADWQKAEQQRATARQQAQQQEKDHLPFEKEKIQELEGEVSDVIEGKGVILNNHLAAEANARFAATMAGVADAWARAGTPNPNPSVPLDTRVRYYFLACDTKQLANGSYVKCRAYQDGFYTYTTVMGGSQKIARWVYYDEHTELPKP